MNLILLLKRAGEGGGVVPRGGTRLERGNKREGQEGCGGGGGGWRDFASLGQKKTSPVVKSLTITPIA